MVILAAQKAVQSKDIVYTRPAMATFGVHSIVMEKSASMVGRGGGCTPNPFISTITYKVVVYAAPERADTLPLFLLYLYMYSVVQFKFLGPGRNHT